MLGSFNPAKLIVIAFETFCIASPCPNTVFSKNAFTSVCFLIDCSSTAVPRCSFGIPVRRPTSLRISSIPIVVTRSSSGKILLNAHALSIISNALSGSFFVKDILC